VLAALGQLLLGGAPAIAGPIGAYFLTAGDNGVNWIVQGATATFYQQNQYINYGESAVAVGDTVRTLHNNVFGTGGFGSQYTLTGTYTGVNFPYPLSGARFYDGTRDASRNYSVEFVSGKVYKMNLDWSNPVLLFDTGFGSNNAVGITYDPTNNSLWVSQWDQTGVKNFSLDGTLLSSFSTGFDSITSLALDPADHTLWMGSQLNEGTFYQFSRNGVPLSTATYANMTGYNTVGGEFAFVIPEPGTGLLVITGLLGVAGWRRARA
jgi:hypothetical protein